MSNISEPEKKTPILEDDDFSDMPPLEDARERYKKLGIKYPFDDSDSESDSGETIEAPSNAPTPAATPETTVPVTVVPEATVTAAATPETTVPVTVAAAAAAVVINQNISTLQKGQNMFNFVVNNLFMAINNSPLMLLFGRKLIKTNNLKQKINKTNEVAEIIRESDFVLAAAYLKGGMAYKAYDKFLTLKNDIDVKTPVTIDYDIVCCIEQINESIELQITDFIIGFMTHNYQILNNNNYINNNFDMIDETNSLPESSRNKLIHLNKIKLDSNEKIIRLINKKILITLFKYPPNPRLPHIPPPFLSLRISVHKNNILERIFDMTFTIEREPFEKVKSLNILEVDNFNGMPCLHIVPDVTSLIQMSLVSLINRGTTFNLYKKCQKDYVRTKYLIDLVESFKGNGRLHLGYVFGTARNNLEYIISILPHCKKNISEEDVRTNFFDKLVGSITVREIVREIIYGNLRTKELEEKKVIIQQLLRDNNVYDYVERNKRKYLKYKQKYLELKNLLAA